MILSLSVSNKKVCMGVGGWVGWALLSFILDFLNFFNFAKPLNTTYWNEFSWHRELTFGAIIMVWDHGVTKVMISLHPKSQFPTPITLSLAGSYADCFSIFQVPSFLNSCTQLMIPTPYCHTHATLSGYLVACSAIHSHLALKSGMLSRGAFWQFFSPCGNLIAIFTIRNCAWHCVGNRCVCVGRSYAIVVRLLNLRWTRNIHKKKQPRIITRYLDQALDAIYLQNAILNLVPQSHVLYSHSRDDQNTESLLYYTCDMSSKTNIHLFCKAYMCESSAAYSSLYFLRTSLHLLTPVYTFLYQFTPYTKRVYNSPNQLTPPRH